MRELVDKQLMLEDAKSWVAMDSYDQHWINNMSAWIKNLPTVEVSDGECISRRAALDAIMGQPPEPHYPSWYAAQIEKLPAAQPEQRWIPCSERLPYAEYGESDNVLATCGYRDVEDGSIRWIKTLYFNGGNWCHPTGETYLEKVYAWMPLPEPYRGGDAE